MATTKPLRLKREHARQQVDIGDEVVDLIIDSPVRHLDHPFSYSLPSSITAVARGSYVSCLFNGKPHRGIVTDIRKRSAHERSLIPITSVLYERPLVIGHQWRLIEKVALHFGISRSRVMNFAFPTPVTKRNKATPAESKIQKNSEKKPSHQQKNAKKKYLYCSGIGENIYERAFSQARSLSQSEPVILIVPDQRDIDHMSEIFKARNVTFYPYTSSMTKTDLFSTYEKALLQTPGIYVGTRSAIWLPVHAAVILVNELDFSYTERHSPFFHCREIALLRSEVFSTPLYFLSVAPSLELAALVHSGTVSISKGISKKIRVLTEKDSHLAVIRRGITQGPVLIVVGEKGYYNSVVCSQCRNHPTCRCGGRFVLNKSSEFLCSLCGAKESQFHCQWCRNEKYLSYRKGSDRIALEIGKAFPHTPLKMSTRDLPLASVNENCIVIATLGMSPQSTSGYSAIVFLDCEMILNRPLLRSEEFARLHWRSALSGMRAGGEVYFSLPNNHREVQSVLRGDVFVSINQELEERARLSLPPAREMAVITSTTRGLTQIGRGIIDEFADAVTIDHDERGGEYRLIIRATSEVMSAVIAVLADVQRVRSARKQSSLTVIRNPIDI